VTGGQVTCFAGLSSFHTEAAQKLYTTVNRWHDDKKRQENAFESHFLVALDFSPEK